jgi:hypothetical protein
MPSCTECVHKIVINNLVEQGYKMSVIFTDDRGITRRQGLRERPFTPGSLSFCSIKLQETLQCLGMNFRSVNELIDMKDQLSKYFDADDLGEACIQQSAIERVNNSYARVRGGLVFFNELNTRMENGKEHAWIPLRKIMEDAASEYGDSCNIFAKKGWR